MSVKEFISRKTMKVAEMLSGTASGLVKSRSCRADTFLIKPFKYQKLIIDQGNFNNIGLGLLSRHICIFDFPNNKLFLKKGKGFDKVKQADMSGLHLLSISDNVFVYSVDFNSPAKNAGIQDKDIILKVNDKDANAYGIWELRRLLKSEDKRKITMTVKREDDVKEVSFLLKKRI